MATPLLWGQMTWQGVRDLRSRGLDMAILPVGSTEQHGPHLPLETDTTLAEAVAREVSARTSVVVLPTLPYGCALGHTRHWPGTLSLSPQVLASVVCELCEDVIAYGFTRLLLLSGHLTNAAPLRTALELLRQRHPHLQIAQKHLLEASPRTRAAYFEDAEDLHANCAETALMQHLAPSLVRDDLILDDPDRTAELFFSYTVPFTSLAGHTGLPSRATPALGAELFEMLVEDWTRQVLVALKEEPPLRPTLGEPDQT
jgi:creatinine amidohydrolase